MSSETSVPWLVQNKPSTPIRRVETRLNSSKDNFIAKSFRLSTKRKLSIPLNFLCPFVSFIVIFSIFGLENHHMMNARQPFCWWMTFTKVSNPFLPSPHKWLTWPLDVLGGVGYGRFYWFSLRIFSQTSLELEICQRDWNNGVGFFFNIIHHERYFFSVQDIFAQEFIFFPPEISLQDIFFWNHSIIPSKVKWSAPKIHQTFGQLTDSDL